MEVLISVIVPVYNAEKYIRRCVESIINQTFSKFELILVNDGSTDKSGDICDHFAKISDKVHVIHQKNSGVSSARNNGMKHAKGKYIEFVDADDYLDKNTLETLFESAEKNNSDVVVFGIKNIVIRDDCIVKEIVRPVEAGVFDLKAFMKSYSSYMPNAIIGASWNKLYKKSLLEEQSISYNSKMKNNEDTFFNYSVLENSKTISVVENIFYNYIDENNNSASKKHRNDLFQVYKKTYIRAVEFLKNSNVLEENLKFQNTYFLNLIVGVIHSIICDKNVINKEKFRIIRDILNDDVVEIALKKYKTPRLDRKIQFFLMKKRRYRLLTAFVQIIKKIK